ncbi:hypothetical protein E2C01_038392 [Portunus trituberculatus]|uniref:Uncharacterized protein n=1 Tax=Portunus trituberculatus TaxID=210409 RepID=A0A5B7FHV2_PORTR|nr:hypothetical protein [Portunus trituberculatus]
MISVQLCLVRFSVFEILVDESASLRHREDCDISATRASASEVDNCVASRSRHIPGKPRVVPEGSRRNSWFDSNFTLQLPENFPPNTTILQLAPVFPRPPQPRPDLFGAGDTSSTLAELDVPKEDNWVSIVVVVVVVVVVSVVVVVVW